MKNSLFKFTVILLRSFNLLHSDSMKKLKKIFSPPLIEDFTICDLPSYTKFSGGENHKEFSISWFFAYTTTQQANDCHRHIKVFKYLSFHRYTARLSNV